MWQGVRVCLPRGQGLPVEWAEATAQQKQLPRTLYSVEVRENFSLNLTTVPAPSLLGRGRTLLVAPLRRLPRCQPIATALEPAGHGCRVCTCRENSKRVAFSRDFHLENMAKSGEEERGAGEARGTASAAEMVGCWTENADSAPCLSLDLLPGSQLMQWPCVWATGSRQTV